VAFDGCECGDGRRRGGYRAVGVLCLVLVSALFALGCGERGNGAETDPEKGSDAEALNASLARELTLLAAYRQGGELLTGPLRAVGRGFRAQQQEYADAIGKAIRGLGGRAEAEPDELDLAAARSQGDFLSLAYELESAALASYLEAAPRLYTSAPRTLAASLAAGHAQHLVLLRQGLGAGMAESVPKAFDGGVLPPPAGGEGPPRG
jgi:Ferritin-like domain